MPLYEYYCQACEVSHEVRHSIHQTDPAVCPDCSQPMTREITVPLMIISKEGGLANHKEAEHKKKVKDPDRAVKMRKKAFGHDAVGDPSMKNDPRHVIRRGKTLGGQEKEVDKREFVKAAAKDNAIVKQAYDAIHKKGKK